VLIEILQNQISYQEGVEMINNAALNGKEKIIIFQHNEHVFTYGKAIKFNDNQINNIKVYKANRGGAWTYHGPKQIIIYFCIDYKTRNIDILKFISLLENFLIYFLDKYFQIKCETSSLGRGVWHKNKKIAFLGLNITKQFITHGISLNFDNDLKYFNYITPCSIENAQITNILNESSNQMDIQLTIEKLKDELIKLCNNNFSSV